MKFRELKLEDLDYCAKHRSENYGESFEESREKLEKKILKSRIKLLVPSIGYALLRDDDKLGFAHLSAILVESQHQGIGFGSKMLELVEEQVLKNGYSGIILSVRTGEDLVRKFYEKNGYSILREENGRTFYIKTLKLK